jgi:hypothetical protein
MAEDAKDQEPPEQPDRLSEDELMQEGANLDESKLEGEGPAPK